MVTVSSNTEAGYGKVYRPNALYTVPFVLYQSGPFRRSDVLTPLKKKYPETTFVSTNDLPRGKGNFIYDLAIPQISF